MALLRGVALVIAILAIVVASVLALPWITSWYLDYSDWVQCHNESYPYSDHCWAWNQRQEQE